MQKELNENWVDIPGYEGKYQVSDLGNVRSLNYNKTGEVKVMKPAIKRDGYCHVTLSKNGKKKELTIHRLGYTTFKGPIPPDMVVDHVNGCKTDNRIENLQLLSGADNTRKSNLGKTPWNKGKKCNSLTAEHRAKIGASLKGQTRSDESKANMKAAQKARYQRKPFSEETKRKISAAHKARRERKNSGKNCPLI